VPTSVSPAGSVYESRIRCAVVPVLLTVTCKVVAVLAAFQ
jgi:hypothetical protein